jgi:hypothetical protein
MKFSPSAILCFALCMAIHSVGNQLNAQTLKFNPKKGASYKYDVSMDMKQTINAMGNEMTMGAKTSSKNIINVNNVSANSSEITDSITSMKMAMNGMEAAGRPDTTITIKDLDQFTQNIQVGTNGKIIKSEFTKKAQSNMESKLVNQMASSRTMMEMLFLGFPEKQLTVGDTWKETRIDTNKQGEDGAIITNSVYKCTYLGTVDTLKTKCHKIGIVTEKLTISGIMNQMGMELTMDGDGASKSTSYFDMEGIPVAAIGSAQMDVRMSMSGQQQMVIPMTMDIKTAMVRTK